MHPIVLYCSSNSLKKLLAYLFLSFHFLFPFDLAKVFEEAAEFAKEIAIKYECPFMFIHTFCDGATALCNYPESLQEEYEEDEDALQIQKCFLKWRAAREDKVKDLLGSDVAFYSCCYGINGK
jgi:hypothetical protein